MGGVLTVWTIGCAVWQVGIGAYLTAIVVLSGVALAGVALWNHRGRWPWLLALVMMALWFRLVGGPRGTLFSDAVCMLLPLAAILGVHVYRERGRRLAAGASVPAARRPLPPWHLFGSLALSWMIISLLDHWRSEPLARSPERFLHVPQAHPLRVGLALSGGGYRAALFHAGVLDALEGLKLRPQCLSSVSGGSIIAGYYVHGGRPRDFVDGVIAGRFNLIRTLANVTNAVRLPFPGQIPGTSIRLLPGYSFNRREVQADLIDRMLLGGTTVGVPLPAGAPAWLVCCTDIAHAWQVGISAEGVLLNGSTSDRFLPLATLQQWPRTARWADLVAISGAFPGAFPTEVVSFSIPARDGSLLPGAANDLYLVDGGVIDNLGLHLLLAASRNGKRAPSRKPPSDMRRRPGGFEYLHGAQFPPSDFEYHSRTDMSSQWSLDLVLASNGGKMLDANEGPIGLAGFGRVIDIATATAAMREEETLRDGSYHAQAGGIPVFMFSPALLGFPADAVMVGDRRIYEHGAPTSPRLTPMRKNLTHTLKRTGVFKRLIALHPEEGPLRATLEQWNEAWDSGLDEAMAKRMREQEEDPLHKIGGLDKYYPDLKATIRTLEPEPSEAQAELQEVDPIRGDIADCLGIFSRAPTLRDQYESGDANAIYRLGHYAVLLRLDYLREAIELAESRITPGPHQ